MSDTERIANEVWDAVKHLKAIASGALPVGRECRVLIVEDDQNDIDMLCRELEKFRVHCTFEKDPVKSTGMIENGHYDVVMIDLIMPRMSGIEVLQKTMSLAKGTSFIAVTGHTQDSPVNSEALKLGGIVSYSKPLTFDKLKNIFPVR